jgi:tetratricopeptide (TPR) repeat protein
MAQVTTVVPIVAAPITVAEPMMSRYEAAAQVLERALHTGPGGKDPNVAYLLALAHKRQGKTQDARNALRKIQKPDANVLLQMGLLSLQESNLAQAEDEFARALDMDETSYVTCYNLLLTRLTLGKVEDAFNQLPRALELVAQMPASAALSGGSANDERRFLLVLQALLRCCLRGGGNGGLNDPLMAALSTADEQRLLKVILSLGQLDTVHTLLDALVRARPNSPAVREAYFDAVLVKGKELIDRCAWTEAELLLRPMQGETGASRNARFVLFNLLGCCSCMTQDFNGAARHFFSALKLNGNDPRVHQNLALCFELMGEMGKAEPHWDRYFDLLDRRIASPSDIPEYANKLAYEALNRLATKFGEKEKWNAAANFVERALRYRPEDPDTLERLFHLYNHAKRYSDGRRILERLRRQRPNDPQMELYELDLIEVKGLNDIERLLNEIDAILKRYPNEPRVQERAVGMVGNVIPLMGNLCDQLTEQMSKVFDQVRHLPNYQINWSAVREVMRDLMREFQKLRRIVGKCMPLVTTDEHRRIIRDLADHIDKKMEACRSMGA